MALDKQCHPRSGDDAVAKASVPGVRAFWQLGSALHFEVRHTPGVGSSKPEEHKRPWQFQELAHVGALPANVERQVRSCLTLPFGEIPAGGVYWEVEVLGAPDPKAMSLGVWLAHAQHFVGCCLADGSAVGLPGAKAAPVPELQPFRLGSVMGLLLTDEELIVTRDGAPFTRVGLQEMTRSAGAEAAIFIGQGQLSQLRLNIGQCELRHLPAVAAPAPAFCDAGPEVGDDGQRGAATRARDGDAGAGGDEEGGGSPDAGQAETVRAAPVTWGHAVGFPGGGGRATGPFAAFAEEPRSAKEVVDSASVSSERERERVSFDC